MHAVGATELIWAAWIVLAVGGSFGLLEGMMIRLKRPTLSWTIWDWSKHWPLLPFLIGMLFGGLGVHFFWIPSTAAGF